jgi:Bacterial membrane protein YfhO
MLASGTLTGTMTKTALKVAWGFTDPARMDAAAAEHSSVGDVVRMSALFQWIPLAGLGVVLIALRVRPSRPLAVAPFVALAFLLLTVDLFRANMGFNTAIPTRLAEAPATGAIRYLRSQRPNRFVGLNQRFGLQPVPPDTAMIYGLYDARGYDYPAEKRYDRLWRRNVAPGVPDFTQPIVLATGTPAAIRALNLLSVSDFIQDAGDKPLRGSSLRLAYRGSDARVYRNPDALPRVFLVGGQQTVGSADAALAAATAPGFDGRRGAVTEREVPGLPQASAATPSAAGSARLVSYADQRVVAEADTTSRSMLVLTDLKYPGWKATVDGHPATTERVDYLLRGVMVPPGRHRVEFTYEPASFRAGWIISLLALLAVVAALVVGLRSRRRAGDA